MKKFPFFFNKVNRRFSMAENENVSRLKSLVEKHRILAQMLTVALSTEIRKFYSKYPGWIVNVRSEHVLNPKLGGMSIWKSNVIARAKDHHRWALHKFGVILSVRREKLLRIFQENLIKIKWWDKINMFALRTVKGQLGRFFFLSSRR